MGADAHSFAFMCFIWIGTIIGSHASRFLRMLMIWQKLINKINLEPHGMDGSGGRWWKYANPSKHRVRCLMWFTFNKFCNYQFLSSLSLK